MYAALEKYSNADTLRELLDSLVLQVSKQII